MSIKNLTPHDARTVELASAGALLLASVLLMVTSKATPFMVSVHPLVFWYALTGLLGSLQLFALITYPKFELLRCVLALTCGAFWVWFGVSSLTTESSISSLVPLILGASNLYAFVVAVLTLRTAWKD